MYISQQSKKQLFLKKSMVLLSLLTAIPLEVSSSEELSFSTLERQKIDIFRKEVSQSELKNIELFASNQGKKAICYLSNKKKKLIWIDEKVLNKIEESTVLQALQKGYRNKNVTCDFKDITEKSGKFDGIVAYPQEGQVVFYDVTSKK